MKFDCNQFKFRSAVLSAIFVSFIFIGGTHVARASSPAALLSRPSYITVSGNYAYITSKNSHALEIVDISNPSAPRHKGSILNGDGGAKLFDPSSVFVVGPYAYVTAALDNALNIIDVSDPVNPVLKGVAVHGVNAPQLQCPSQVVVSGAYAYITATGCGNANPGNIEILDISNPALPTYVGGFSASWYDVFASLAMCGQYLCVVDNYTSFNSGALYVFDISNPTHPVIVAGVTDGNNGATIANPTFLHVSGNYAYISSLGSSSLEIIDITDPINPVHAGKISGADWNESSFTPRGVFVSGAYAYVTSFVSSTLEVIDVSNPTDPFHEATIVDGDNGAALLYPISVFVSGDNAYIVSYLGNSLEVVDISDPSDPVHKSKLLDGEVGECAVGCYSNVLFLPGLEASRLYKPDYNGGTTQLWEPELIHNNSQLNLDFSGASIRDDIYTKDVIDTAYFPGRGNIYKSFIDDLRKWKDVDHIINDYSLVPYDWRLSISDILNYGSKFPDGRIYYSGPLAPTPTPHIISELRRLASTSSTGKVTIIAHSNGGLVTKALTDKLGSEASALIDKIIFVAVPQAGTPQAVGAILHGYEQGLPKDWLPIFINPQESRSLAKNMSSAYNLLPSYNYFTYTNDPVVTFDNSTLLAPWRARYGSIIHSSARLHDFIIDQSRISLPVTDPIKFPISGNLALLNNAEVLHNTTLDNWAPPVGVKLTEIAGWGEKTLATIEYEQGWQTLCVAQGACVTNQVMDYNVKEVLDGDGTVVTSSALWTPGADKYWVNLDRYNNRLPQSLGHLDRRHADILEVPDLGEFIKNIITGTTSQLAYISNSAPQTTNTTPRLRFTLHSPLSLDLYDDQGNHTGISPTTGFLEENIPESRYKTYGELKYIEVSATIPIHLAMKGYATGSFTLDVNKEQGGIIVESTKFAGIPSSVATVATMDVPTNSGVGTLDLKIDQNGDGVVDKILPATSDGVTIYDVTPPELQVTFDTKTRDVALSAQDTVDPNPMITLSNNATNNSVAMRDKSGNTASITFKKFKELPTRLRLTYNRIIRNGVTIEVPNTNIVYDWKEKKDVVTDLDTRVTVKGVERYVFNYNKEKNVTIIRENLGKEVPPKMMPGFVVVTVKTEGDTVKVSY